MKNSLRKFLVYNLWPMAFGLLLLGCVTTEYNVGTGKQDVYFYSTESEVAMGQNIAKKIYQEFKLSNSPDDIERLNRIANKITDVLDRRELSYYFYIIEEDQEGKSQVNAFSLPGGYSYIFSGLLDILDNDDQLAFILAHEVGHIVSRHHMKRLQAAMGYNLLTVASTAAGTSSEFRNGLSFALFQILAGYSREDEFNADELAVKYCKLAGFDPAAGIEVLEKLYEESKKTIRSLSYFRTHPYPAQRIRHIKEALQLPLNVDDYINF
ncbi:MAG: M48 family metalloprotease [Candidatus Omnitrophica bacterium]|nr:M48 family metalloprotease [Candidatus Omnitrophota bacterium]